MKSVFATILLGMMLVCRLVYAQNDSAHETSNSSDSKPPIYQFNIASKNLNLALIEFAEITHITLVFPSFDIENLKSNAIHGEFTREQALTFLLANSGLEASITNDGRIKLSRVELPLTPMADKPTLTEEVIVKGLRRSLLASNAIKQQSTQIIEVVMEEEIGRMPDKTVGEVLQRLPGVQVEQQAGFGNNIRIRGFNQNLILFNGESILTGMEFVNYQGEYIEGSFENIPADLIRQVNVYKTPFASQVDGSIGGSIDLITRKPSDFDTPVFITEMSVDQGLYSKEAQPSLSVIFANQWTETFSSVFTVFAGQQTYSTDLVNMYDTSTSSFIDQSNQDGLVAFIEDKPFLKANVATAGNSTKMTDVVGTILNFEYEFSDNNRIALDILSNALNSEIHTRNIEHHLYMDAVPEMDLDFSSPLGAIERGEFNVRSAKGDVSGSINDVQANNAILTVNNQLTERLTMISRLMVGESSFKQRNGIATVYYGNYYNAQWVGDASPTGWYWQSLTDDTPFDYIIELENNGDEPRLSYQNSELLTNVDYGVFSNQFANGYDLSQQQQVLRFDFSYDSGIAGLDMLTFGMRHQNNRVANDALYYLTDFSKTTGVPHPNLYDENGNLVTPTNYDINVPPDSDDENVAFRFPVWHDLCNNGGLLSNQQCDINGDSIDDNRPVGTYGYYIGSIFDNAPTIPPFIYSQPELLAMLGINQFDFLSLYLPHVPTRFFNDVPSQIQTVDSLMLSLPYQSSILIPDAEDITRNVGAWINAAAPRSPASLYSSPTRSWSLDKESSSIYFESLGELAGIDIQYSLGVRAVYTTHQGTRRKSADDMLSSSLVFDSFGFSFPFHTMEETYEKSKWYTLPNFNIVWKPAKRYQFRLNASKAIATPRTNNIAMGQVDNDGLFFLVNNGEYKIGNPELDNYQISQLDFAFEYIGNEELYVYSGVFYKNIDTNIIDDLEDITVNGYDTKLLTLTNDSIGSVKGAELSLVNAWDNGIGVQMNYTYTETETGVASYSRDEIGLSGVSDHLFNFIGFYENNYLSVRLAYLFQSDRLLNRLYFQNFSDQEIVYLAQYFDDYAQLDARLTWYINDKFSLSADIFNLTNEHLTTYIEYENIHAQYIVVEPRYSLSLKYDF